jgi:GxxExxY protein
MRIDELTAFVIGKCIELHKTLGPGLLESVYQDCLYFELINAGLHVVKQQPIPLVYKDVKLPCGFRCDLLIEGKLIIEVKAVDALNNVHTAQLLTYLKLTNIRWGLLINFNVVKLKDGIKRVVNGY